MESPFGTREFWWKNARIYELYVDKFADNLPGLAARLDYFSALGIDCLHLLPHYPSPMVDGGYDVSDYRAVRPELGTLDDFKRLIASAHARGIRIVIDFVLNHTSAEHPWFIEARASKRSPKRDFYLWRGIDYGFEGASNMFPDLKPRNWIFNPATEDYYFATFYPEQPDLNWDNPEVFEAMMANMEFWAGMGVDGFRLDAIPYLIKRENSSCKGLPETHEIIKRIRRRLESKYPDAILLAESHQTVALTKQYFSNGDECHLAYHFPLAEAMWMALMLGERERAAEMEEESFSDIPDNCAWAVFLRNHDEISLSTLDPEDRAQLLQALDPSGEYLFKKMRATAARIATAFNGDEEKIREAFDLLYSLPGAKVMYYGDEIGMRNLPVEEGIIDARIYVRGAFNWAEAQRQMKDPLSLWSHAREAIRRVPAPVEVS